MPGSPSDRAAWAEIDRLDRYGLNPTDDELDMVDLEHELLDHLVDHWPATARLPLPARSTNPFATERVVPTFDGGWEAAARSPAAVAPSKSSTSRRRAPTCSGRPPAGGGTR